MSRSRLTNQRMAIFRLSTVCAPSRCHMTFPSSFTSHRPRSDNLLQAVHEPPSEEPQQKEQMTGRGVL